MRRRTIKRHFPKRLPPGDYEAMCDLCGVMYYRSELRKLPRSSLLACDEDFEKGAAQLSYEIAREASAPRPTYRHRGGNFDNDGPDSDGTDNTPDGNRTSAADTGL